MSQASDQTPRLRAILAAMTERSREGQHGFTGVEHLLLALLDDPSIVQRVHWSDETRGALRAELETELRIAARDPRFPSSPQPWGSMLLTDEAGEPSLGPDGRPLQYLVDAEWLSRSERSRAISNDSYDDAGNLLRDGRGRPRLEAVRLP